MSCQYFEHFVSIKDEYNIIGNSGLVNHSFIWRTPGHMNKQWLWLLLFAVYYCFCTLLYKIFKADIYWFTSIRLWVSVLPSISIFLTVFFRHLNYQAFHLIDGTMLCLYMLNRAYQFQLCCTSTCSLKLFYDFWPRYGAHYKKIFVKFFSITCNTPCALLSWTVGGDGDNSMI